VQAAWESARRSSCTNNLKQQALGVHGYHAAADCLPPADHKATWSVLILPYVEEAGFFGAWDLRKCVYEIPQATRCARNGDSHQIWARCQLLYFWWLAPFLPSASP
jgi:hypothetical protein